MTPEPQATKDGLPLTIPPLGSLAIHESMCWRCVGTGKQYKPVMWVHAEGEVGRPVHSSQCEVCMGSGEVFVIAKPKPLDMQGLVDRMNALMPKRPITEPPAIGMPPMFGPGDYLDYHRPRKDHNDA